MTQGRVNWFSRRARAQAGLGHVSSVPSWFVATGKDSRHAGQRAVRPAPRRGPPDSAMAVTTRGPSGRPISRAKCTPPPESPYATVPWAGSQAMAVGGAGGTNRAYRCPVLASVIQIVRSVPIDATNAASGLITLALTVRGPDSQPASGVSAIKLRFWPVTRSQAQSPAAAAGSGGSLGVGSDR